MGNYIFNVSKHASTNIPVSFNPSNYEWLHIYSLETGLSIIEIKRLWYRFQQLGCDNNGLWTPQLVSKSNNKIGKNRFQQKILQSIFIPDQQTVTFYDFLNAACWLERSTVEDKLKASYAIINDNNPITIDSLTRFLTLLFVGKKKEEIDNIVIDLFTKIGIENNFTKDSVREIGEEDFIFFLKSNISEEKLLELFSFKILPNLKPAISEEKKQKIQSSNLNEITDDLGIPTDSQLESIAQAIGGSEYKKLAGLLGILPYDIVHIENVHRKNRFKIVYSILREWKQREGARALFSLLKRALYDAGFIEILNKIEFG